MAEPSLSGRVQSLVADMKTMRSHSFESRMERARKWIRPDDAPFGSNPQNTPSDVGRNMLVTSYAENVSDTFAEAVSDLLANPRTRWFEVEGDHDGHDLANIEEMLYTTVQTGFYQAFQAVVQSIGDYGTGAIMVHDVPGNAPWFEDLPMQTTWIAEGPFGTVDTIAREFILTKAQIMERFPDAGTKPDEPMEKMTCSQVICKPETLKLQEKAPWVSITIGDEEKVLEHGYYNSKPFGCARWKAMNGEVYGRAPGHAATRSVESLQKMTLFTVEAAEALVYPAIYLTDDGVSTPPVQGPKGVNYIRADLLNNKLPPIGMMPTGQRPDIGDAIVQSLKTEIDAAYKIHNLVPVPDPRRTATQDLILESTRLAALGGPLWRISVELLMPIMQRVLDIAVLNGNVPADGSVTIRIPTAMERGRNTDEAAAMARFVEIVTAMAQINPDAADLLDTEAHIRRLADIMGLKPDLVPSKAKVRQMRQQRAEMMQMQQEAEAFQQGASGLQSVAQAAQGVGVGGRPRGS